MKVLQRFFILVILTAVFFNTAYSALYINNSQQKNLSKHAQEFGANSISFLNTDFANKVQDQNQKQKISSFLETNKEELEAELSDTVFYYLRDKERFDKFKAKKEKIECKSKKIRNYAFEDLKDFVSKKDSSLVSIFESQKDFIQENLENISKKPLTNFFNESQSIGRKFVNWFRSGKKPVEKKQEKQIENTKDTITKTGTAKTEATKTEPVKQPVAPAVGETVKKEEPVKKLVLNLNNLQNLKTLIRNSLQNLDTSIEQQSQEKIATCSLKDFLTIHKNITDKPNVNLGGFEKEITNKLNKIKSKILNYLVTNNSSDKIPLDLAKLNNLKDLIFEYKEELEKTKSWLRRFSFWIAQKGSEGIFNYGIKFPVKHVGSIIGNSIKQTAEWTLRAGLFLGVLGLISVYNRSDSQGALDAFLTPYKKAGTITYNLLLAPKKIPEQNFQDQVNNFVENIPGKIKNIPGTIKNFVWKVVEYLPTFHLHARP